MQTSLSPPQDPFNRRLKNIVPTLMKNMAIDKTKKVIKNVFMLVKITPLSVFNKMNIYENKWINFTKYQYWLEFYFPIFLPVDLN